MAAGLRAAALDDPAQVEAADPGGMLRLVASSAAQVRSSLLATQEAGLRDVLAEGRPRAVVVAGSGAAGLAGDLLAAVCGPGCPVQILTVRGYQLPGWVSVADLVFAVSAPGQAEAEETLAAATDAARRGCRLVAVGDPDSGLHGVAEQARAPFVPVRPAGPARATPARAALWGLAVPLVATAARLGLCDAGAEAHEAAAGVLEDVSQRCRPDLESFVNPGKELALDLAGTLPVIWGASPLAAVAARRFASQLAENAKYPALHGALPEAGRSQLALFDGPFAPGPATPWTPGAPDTEDEPPDLPLRLVMLADTREDPRVTARREACGRLAAERGADVTELAATGDHPLVRLASLVQLTDYASVYLGIALGLDPSASPAIAN